MAGLPPLPVFWELADGIGGNLGTETPPGALIINGPDGADDYVLQESTSSPTFERAEQATVTKTFVDIPWEDSITYISGLGRGTVLMDNEVPPNVFTVLSATQQRERGNKASITIVSEARSFDVPPDDFEIVPVELGLDILRHPRYRLALDPTIADLSNRITVPGDAGATVSASWVKQIIIRAIQTYRDSPVFPTVDNINGYFQNNILVQFFSNAIQIPYTNPNYKPGPGTPDAPVAWDGTVANTPVGNSQYWLVQIPISDPVIQFALAAAMEIITKIWRMEDTPYLAAFQITWTSYSFRPPYLNPGAYLENPITEASPALPDYFWNPNPTNERPPPNSPGGITPHATIFDLFAQLNTQSYSNDGISTDPSNVVVSSLRKADQLDYQRTWFACRRSWIISVIGHFDSDIYFRGPRPTLATYNADPPNGYEKLGL